MSERDQEVQEFLQLMNRAATMNAPKPPEGFLYSSPYDFLLRHGRVFESRLLKADGMEVVKSAVGRRKLPVKECFSNAADVVLNDASGRLQYCEGFAHRVIPVHHAWAVLDGETVIDLTWNKRKRLMTSASLKSKIMGDLDDAAYFGIVFSRERLGKALLECEHYDSLLMDFRRGYPLLREEFDAKKELTCPECGQPYDGIGSRCWSCVEDECRAQQSNEEVE